MSFMYAPLPELRGRDEAEGARLSRPAERRRQRLLRAARGVSRELGSDLVDNYI